MTPELKAACELVFQEHKASGKPFNWNKDSFRGRLSFGLAAMAKQTLEKRNIICTLNPAKKTITTLNPLAVTAANFEEATEMVQNKIPVLVTNKVDDEPAYITHRVSGFAHNSTNDTGRLVKIRVKSTTPPVEIKRWIRPLFSYIIWLICALVGGALITYLLSLLI